MPNLSCDPNNGAAGSFYQFFNTSCFSAPPQDVRGSAGVGIDRGPGTNNWNVSLRIVFQPFERVKAEFRGDLFNAFNHTQWSSVNTTYSSAAGNTFGWVTGARDPRSAYLSLRVSF